MSLQDYIFIVFLQFELTPRQERNLGKTTTQAEAGQVTPESIITLFYLILEAELSGSGWPIIINKIQTGTENA